MAEDKFISKLKYQNGLPDAPSGPFFKKISLYHAFEDFAEYQTSTLEKSFVWKPHLGPDMGLNLDLVDQETMMSIGTHQPIDPKELRYLTAPNDKVRGKLKQVDQSLKPWWLRNTTYIENNLFNMVDKPREQKRSETKKVNFFSKDYIENSFQSVDKTLESLISSNTQRKVVVDLPLLPYSEYDEDQNRYSLVRFDEEAGQILDSRQQFDELEPSSKKRKFMSSIITNVSESNGDINSNKFESSLVVPVEEKTDDDERKYTWVKNYTMEYTTMKPGDNYLVVLDEFDKKSTYYPITSRAELKKLNTSATISECHIKRVLPEE